MFFGLTAIDHPCVKMQEVVESFFFESIDHNTFSVALFPEWFRTTIRVTPLRAPTRGGESGKAIPTQQRATLGDRFKAVHTHLHASSMSRTKRQALYDQLIVINQVEELCEGAKKRPKDVIEWNSSMGKAIIDLMESLYSSLDLAVFRRDGSNEQPTRVFYKEFVEVNRTICPFCGLDRMKNPFGPARGDFDHYLNRARYPLAAVNFKNLIPTCDPCNTDHKKAKDILADGVAFYPYSDMPKVSVEIECTKYPEPGAFGDRGSWDVKIGVDRSDQQVETKLRTWNRVYSIKERLVNEIKNYGEDWMSEVADNHPTPVTEHEFEQLIALARSTAEIRAQRRKQPGQIVRAAFYDFMLTKADRLFLRSFLVSTNALRSE